MFDFTHIRPFDWARVDEPEPMVLFASPGMLHSGASLEVFKKWAGDEKNMIIMPGFVLGFSASLLPGSIGMAERQVRKKADYSHR
jgi:Cft2 family RNA processing exonuclease